MDTATEQIIEQRVRNRIWEYCDGVAAYERERWTTLEEIINLWEDFVDRPLQANAFPSPVYSTPESERLLAVDDAWLRFADSTPQSIPHDRMTVDKVLGTPEWMALAARCEEAIQEFSKRGRFSEEEEFNFS